MSDRDVRQRGIAMKRILTVMLLVGLAVSSRARADAPATSQPSNATLAGELELQANEDMGRKDYAAAAVLLQKVETLLADQPDQLGPIMEQLRVCRKQVLNSKSAGPQQSVAAAVDGGPRHIHSLPASGETVEMPIKELGNFDYDATSGGNIPDDVKRMEGARFKTTGYMIPLDQAESISEFALVPSLFACCFGQPPQIQHTIIVTCPKSKAVNYFPDELVVEGTLHVKEVKDGGFIVSIFQMDAASVKAAPQ
jgi:hypothetical protein